MLTVTRNLYAYKVGEEWMYLIYKLNVTALLGKGLIIRHLEGTIFNSRGIRRSSGKTGAVLILQR
jgi:hypothetical protein